MDIDVSMLYEQHAAAMYRYIRRRIPSSDADDVLQEVFMQVAEDVDQWNERGVDIRAWLYRIAHNRVVDFFRRRACRPVCIALEPHHATTEIETTAINNVRDDLVRAAIANLTEAQRQVIWLRFFEDCTIPETAARLGISESAANARQRSAFMALEKQFGVSLRKRRQPSAAYYRAYRERQRRANVGS